MSPLNPFRMNEVKEVPHDITLYPGDIDFLLQRLHSVASACLFSSFPVENHLEIQGGKLSSTHNFACNVEESKGKIVHGSLSIVSDTPPSALLLNRNDEAPYWKLVTDQDKPLTNSDIIGALRQANPRIVPVHAFPLGKETSDTTLFSVISDSIKPFNRKVVTKVFSLLDVEGIESVVSERHGRLIHAEVTDGKTKTTNISIDRWFQMPLYDANIDVGYQLINSAVGRRKESLIGRVVFQSSSEFLNEYAQASRSLPHPKDFAANMASLLDDLENQAHLASL